LIIFDLDDILVGKVDDRVNLIAMHRRDIPSIALMSSLFLPSNAFYQVISAQNHHHLLYLTKNLSMVKPQETELINT
jgi:hypothetical protein